MDFWSSEGKRKVASLLLANNTCYSFTCFGITLSLLRWQYMIVLPKWSVKQTASGVS